MSSRRGVRTLGITGPIASGKTAVGDILLTLGARARIDADEVVHELMAANTEVTRQIAGVFGPHFVTVKGDVDRRALGEFVFNDAEAMTSLERIVHPAVTATIRSRLADLESRRSSGTIVVDAVKLVQSDLIGYMDAVWLVRCSVDCQRRRLIDLRNLSPAQAEARIASQPVFDPDFFDEVIDNDGTLGELEQEVKAAWRRQRSRWTAT